MKDLLIKIAVIMAVSLSVWLPIVYFYSREQKQFSNNNKDNYYILRQPRFVFGIGVITTVLFFIAFILAVFVSHEWVGIASLPFCVLGMSLAIYASSWKIIVTNNTLEIHSFMALPKKVNINNVELVLQVYNGMIAYMDGKKIFGMESWVVGYDLLYEQLHRLNKMESTLSGYSFSVKRSKAEPVIGILSAVFFAGILIWIIIKPNETATPLVYAFFIGFTLFSTCYTVSSLRWKLMVADDLLIYRKLWMKEKTIPLKNIDKVLVKKNTLDLIGNGKTIIKVEPVYNGYVTLVERFQKEQIPFYYKNKQIDLHV